MTVTREPRAAPPVPLDVLESVQRRVLWLAVSLVHHANLVRRTASGVKVGGHQASSASMVGIMTALYFAHLGAADRVSVKPHASPVLHAINYLLGRLDPRYLTELRAYGGLQSYPSRVKDPDPVDFSTGSVGIGATATVWSALAHRYVSTHFAVPSGGRSIALLGDAELDEGAIWECLLDPMVAHLSDVLWVVDLNRQSLDRVVPDIAAGRIRSMFEAAGWHTITVKYGRRLRAVFDRPGGEALRRRIDGMSNEEYQHLLRTPTADLREQIAAGLERADVLRATGELDDREVRDVLRDLGGHDLGDLLEAYADAARFHDRPTVVFAYTIKAWGLPTEGHPGNHSALLTPDQWRALGEGLGASSDDPWAAFPPESREAELCARAAERLARPISAPAARITVPDDLRQPQRARTSTQAAFGTFFGDLRRTAPEVASRVVTVSPDVATSTSLGTWINHVGIWRESERQDWFADDPERLVRWRQGEGGQHIELGISEVNLVSLLGELGSTWSRHGEPLLPIGTLYDPFVSRALEPWSFGIYAGGQSILIGTPSGVTLAPEGGAHHSIITPSIGLEQPGCIAWEPAFAQDLEWTLLSALSRLGRKDGTSAYFRLSTRPLEQRLAAVPEDARAREERRAHVVAGGYALRRALTPPEVVLVGMGVVMQEVIAAADELEASGIACDVLCVTSADLLFRAWRARQGLAAGDESILDALLPEDRRAPIVSVLDGHPHTLSFLGGVVGQRMACLGVNDFGQSGDVQDLYRHFGIDTETIVGAALDLLR
ncbi:MAG: pyruvate dehydrogenase [Deltaproteobacteria bacterium]|nr:pyruvate dehydrogenase [Deltaproteobacteria bacterium]